MTGNTWNEQLYIGIHNSFTPEYPSFPVFIKLKKDVTVNLQKEKIAQAVLIEKLPGEETVKVKNEWTFVKRKSVISLLGDI